MSTYSIEIDDKAVVEQVEKILNQIINRELSRKYTCSDKVIANAVKEIAYSRKDEIINQVVERASKEIVRKGLPKLLDKMEV